MARVRARITNQARTTRNLPVRAATRTAAIQAGSQLGVPARTHVQRGPFGIGQATPQLWMGDSALSQWIPAVTNLNVAGNLGKFVLHQGGNKGWLYQGAMQPRMVAVLATQQGGPTGMLVRIGPASVAAAINPAASDVGSLVAETPREPDPTAGCCIVEELGTYTDPDTGYTIQTGGYVNCPGGVTQWALHGRMLPATTMSAFEQNGQRMIVVETGDGSFTLPACAPPPTVDDECCVDINAMRLVCAPGHPLDGAQVTGLGDINGGLQTLTFIDPRDGVERSTRFPVCEQPPGRCCYDVATGTLRCPANAGLNGQQVSLISMTRANDGSIVAIVQIQGQSGVATFPVCDDRVSDCCYDTASQSLRCPNDPALNGTAAGILASWNNNGQIWVWATWAGGGARMPVCPGQVECPPAFCCVNVETMRFVCPSRVDLNGQPVQLADIINDRGFNWGVLPDGTRLPLCGRDCPPPEVCPECPGCPPGMWMSPDGTCTPPPECPPPRPCPECPPPPAIPRCPPGMLLDTTTMQCVRCGDRPKQPCPPYPGPAFPWPRMSGPMRGRALNPSTKACCKECEEKAARNPGGDCGCSGKQTNPKVRSRIGRRVVPQKVTRRGPR